MDFFKSLKLKNKQGQTVDAAQLQGKTVALYFSAHWCPPCKAFTPRLKEFYNDVTGAGNQLEIIFVSSDRTQQEAEAYYAGEHGDWLMLDMSQANGLSEKFGTRGIPSLIVADATGKAVVEDARDHVAGTTGKGTDAEVAAFKEWAKHTIDWRTTAGKSTGGTTVTDKDAMRAARLARLGGGGGPPPPAPAPAPEPAPAPAPDQQSPAVMQLVAMGFGADAAANALEAAGGNVDQAAEILISG